MYNFDKIIQRERTSNVKYDLRESYFGNADVLPMWVADMDFETPDFIRNAVIERANHSIYGYSFRNDEYHQSIIDWVKRRFDWHIQKDWILFSPGVVPALNFSVLSYTEPGDGIIVQPPVYFPFFSAVEKNERRLIENRLVLEDNHYVIDFDDLEKKSKEAKLLFLCSPHNPVGRCWTPEELARIGNICLENDVILISDEIHNDLILPGFNHFPSATLSDEIAKNTITFIAPSKTFNLAGLHTSSVIISDEKLRSKFQNTLDRLRVTGGNIFGAVASQAGYTYGDKWLDEVMIYINKNFELLYNRLDDEFETIGLIPAEATYLAWLDFRKTGMTDDKIKDLLINKAGLGLSHGPIFGTGGSGFQRMNLAAPKQTINFAFDQLKKAFN